MYNLNNKVAVVTGSGRGIGREIAIALAKQGASVVVNVKKRVEDGNETLRLIQNESSGIMVQADVSSRDGCRRILDETLAKFGKCDILVNNAGISIAMPFLESDDRLIEKTISTNLMSTIYCSQEFGKIMTENGTIINISSIAGIKPMSFLSIYGITKSAIIRLTEYLAVELAHRRIRVNAVAPGVVKTKMGASLLELLQMSEEEYSRKYTLTNRMITT
jgi:3-oxoacyl-[acyl-carrier protein] reductase